MALGRCSVTAGAGHLIRVARPFAGRSVHFGDPMQGHLRFDAAEVEAMRRTTSAGQARSAQATDRRRGVEPDPGYRIGDEVGTHDWPGRRVLGRPKVEWSTLGAGTATGTKLIIMGDFGTGCKMVARLGMCAELIPHMMGTNRRSRSASAASTATGALAPG